MHSWSLFSSKKKEEGEVHMNEGPGVRELINSQREKPKTPFCDTSLISSGRWSTIIRTPFCVPTLDIAS